MVRPGRATADIDPGEYMLRYTSLAEREFLDPDGSERRFLLDEGTHGFHSSDHRWGSGFPMSSAGQARWATPSQAQIAATEVRADHALAAGLTLAVTRTGGDVLRERYEFTNDGTETVTVSSLGINTPFCDIYESAAMSLEQAVHAHVWTGGEDSWVLAEPMSGKGWSLGLVVRTGGLWAYSIESRNAHTSSNVRGHLVLHATDRVRNPVAFGGQPLIEIPAGGSWDAGVGRGLLPRPGGVRFRDRAGAATGSAVRADRRDRRDPWPGGGPPRRQHRLGHSR